MTPAIYGAAESQEGFVEVVADFPAGGADGRTGGRNAKAASPTQRWTPRPEPCSVPQRAMTGRMPRPRGSRRWES